MLFFGGLSHAPHLILGRLKDFRILMRKEVAHSGDFGLFRKNVILVTESFWTSLGGQLKQSNVFFVFEIKFEVDEELLVGYVLELEQVHVLFFLLVDLTEAVVTGNTLIKATGSNCI